MSLIVLGMGWFTEDLIQCLQVTKAFYFSDKRKSLLSNDSEKMFDNVFISFQKTNTYLVRIFFKYSSKTRLLFMSKVDNPQFTVGSNSK